MEQNGGDALSYNHCYTDPKFWRTSTWSKPITFNLLTVYS